MSAPSAGGPARFDALQVVAAVAAVYLLVLGIVAIARAGFFTEGATSPVVEVGAISATPILGLGLLVVGLVLLWAAGGVVIDDVSIRVVSGIVLVLGIVLLIEPAAFRSVLGTDRGDGWHHALVGGTLMVVSFLPPFETPGRTGPPAPDRSPPPPGTTSPPPGTTRQLPDRDAPPRDDDPTERIR